MKGYNTIGQENLKYYYYSHNLPHLFDINKPVFVTYRLRFTMPKSILDELIKRKIEWFDEIKSLEYKEKQQYIAEQNNVFFTWYDELIAKSEEIPNFLHRPDIRDIISASFRFFDNQRYQLLAYCIMPNHVHVLMYPVTQANGDIYSTAHITYTWKRFTANQINKILNREGSLWQRESYDHLVKNEKELYHTLTYIIDNPVKAGLSLSWDEWQGTWIKEDLRPGV
jgi:REP element-mobilizing transposase RayT